MFQWYYKCYGLCHHVVAYESVLQFARVHLPCWVSHMVIIYHYPLVGPIIITRSNRFKFKDLLDYTVNFIDFSICTFIPVIFCIYINNNIWRGMSNFILLEIINEFYEHKTFTFVRYTSINVNHSKLSVMLPDFTSANKSLHI